MSDCIKCKSCGSIMDGACVVCGFNLKEYKEYCLKTLEGLVPKYGSLQLKKCAEWVTEKFPGEDKNLTLKEMWEKVKND